MADPAERIDSHLEAGRILHARSLVHQWLEAYLQQLPPAPSKDELLQPELFKALADVVERSSDQGLLERFWSAMDRIPAPTLPAASRPLPVLGVPLLNGAKLLLRLLEVLDNSGSGNTALRQRGTNTDLLSTSRGALIDDISVSVATGGANVNVFGNSSDLSFSGSDVHASGSGGVDNLRLFGDTSQASINTGSDNDNVAAFRNVTNSTFDTGSGSDNVRIGGSADNSVISLGGNTDNLVVGRASTNLDVAAGSGNDSVTFASKLKAGASGNAIRLEGGDDQVIFADGINDIRPQDPSTARYLVDLGSGKDVAIFGANSTSERVDIAGGAGADTIILGKSLSDSNINLGVDNDADSLVLGSRGSMTDVTVTSSSTGSTGDVLSFAGTVNYSTASTSTLGQGDDYVSFTGDTDFGGVANWNLGAGADTLTMAGGGTFLDANISLGNDSAIDRVVFDNTSMYAGFMGDFVISDFGTNDVLVIGSNSYAWTDIDTQSEVDDLFGAYNNVKFTA